MIDWITAVVPIRAACQLRTGEIASCDADGTVEWVTTKRIGVRGSHDQQVMVRPRGSEIEFSGCPAKFLQGHNVFGSDNLIGVGAEMIVRACGETGIELLDSEVSDIREGRYTLLRVDINYSFATGSRANALAWIDSAAAVGSLQHRGRSPLRKSTVTWGEGSRYWMLKASSKGDETEAHQGARCALPSIVLLRGLSPMLLTVLNLPTGQGVPDGESGCRLTIGRGVRSISRGATDSRTGCFLIGSSAIEINKPRKPGSHSTIHCVNQVRL